MSGAEDLQPLGVLAIMGFAEAPDRAADALRPLMGAVSDDESSQIAAYLRDGSVVLAIMEQTHDVVGADFSVAGGSGIQTDGRFFWRVDAADYVERYKIRLPSEFIEHGYSLGWQRDALTAEGLRHADEFLADFYRASLDGGLWPIDA